MRRILGSMTTSFLWLLAAGTAAAQDPLVVAPDNYRLLLDNDAVRVFEVRIEPGQKTAMHAHQASLIYVFADCRIRHTFPDGRSTVSEARAGHVVWTEGETHSSENLGSTPIRVLKVEFKKAPADGAGSSSGTH